MQFDPSARHLVALVSGGTGIQNAPSYFVKMRMPSLEVIWRSPWVPPHRGSAQGELSSHSPEV